jgi:hypothetical protein
MTWWRTWNRRWHEGDGRPGAAARRQPPVPPGAGADALTLGADLVDALQHGRIQAHVGGLEIVFQLLHGARADDGGGHPVLVHVPGQRQLGKRHAHLLGQGQELLHGVQAAGHAGIVGIGQGPQMPALLGQGLAPPVLARQPATRQGAPGDHGGAELAASGQDLVFDAAVEEVVGRLFADETGEAAPVGYPVALHQLPGGEGRRADVPDLALADEVIEGVQRLLDGGLLLGPVDLVEVNVVRLQAPQTGLHLLEDVLPVVAPVVRPVPHAAVHLGRQDHPLAPAAGEGLAHRHLRCAAVGVDVGGVEEIDARVQGGVHDADGLVLRGASPEHHAAQTEGRHAHPCAAQQPVLDRHVRNPPCVAAARVPGKRGAAHARV